LFFLRSTTLFNLIIINILFILIICGVIYTTHPEESIYEIAIVVIIAKPAFSIYLRRVVTLISIDMGFEEKQIVIN